ncbi:MAG TPA: cytochrome c oxidase subunit II [Stellaceae bacterium]|nr:cytochrome c oxidase subunit II [Stellaceae bacterium]
MKTLAARAGAALTLAALTLAAPGLAQAAEPKPWELGMQPAATPITERIHSFHHELLVIISLITLFVLGLLLYVILRFNHRRHPAPTKTSHNPVIEILWTVVPVVILVIIAIPSFKLMYYMDRVPPQAMTIKVTGHQWYWSYAYPDQGGFEFNSNVIPEDQLKPGQKRLLDVDNPLVLPVKTNVRVQVTGTDVIHSWFIPSFGVQEYAIIGRLNEAWLNVKNEGTYYGECNQICGVNHAFMPIEIKVVSQSDFQKWVADQKKAAGIDGGGTTVAAGAATPAAARD